MGPVTILGKDPSEVLICIYPGIVEASLLHAKAVRVSNALVAFKTLSYSIMTCVPTLRQFERWL